MPIIKAKETSKKEQIRICIDKSTADEMRQYCEWAGVKKIDDFFEQAAQHILTKDKEWLAHASQKETV